MPILNIAGYKFITLSGLIGLQQSLQALCTQQALKGTILLSEEGINVNLAGPTAAIQTFKNYLKKDRSFIDIHFHEMHSEMQPFQCLKVKIKKEIITLRQPEIKAEISRAPSITPEELKQWLDEKRDMTLLDTRNDFEVRVGTFNDAIHLQLNHFGELPSAIGQLNGGKPLVMFCTGGIRCEKAALYMLNHGFSEVYQLDGGILGYFAQVGSAHYSGECFVFDERVSVSVGSLHSI